MKLPSPFCQDNSIKCKELLQSPNRLGFKQKPKETSVILRNKKKEAKKTKWPAMAPQDPYSDLPLFAMQPPNLLLLPNLLLGLPFGRLSITHYLNASSGNF